MPAVMEAIDRMTTAEKVEVMNYLWGSVVSSGEMFVPVWHIEDLGNTAKSVKKKKGVAVWGAQGESSDVSRLRCST